MFRKLKKRIWTAGSKHIKHSLHKSKSKSDNIRAYLGRDLELRNISIHGLWIGRQEVSTIFSNANSYMILLYITV